MSDDMWQHPVNLDVPGDLSRASLDTPVVFFIWRRPELTRRVFAQIVAARPKTLIIIADGWTDGDVTCAQRCAEAREIVRCIDWPCTIHRNYASTNLGLRERLETGLDFAFSVVDRAIILEDDCLPHHTFFDFAQEMLLTLGSNDRIAGIGGYKPPDVLVPSQSYGFTSYTMVWGWATWRRVWLAHDRMMTSWPQSKQNGLMFQVMGSAKATDFWTSWLDRQHRRETKSYAVSFMYNCFSKGLYFTIPTVNLISNIGFGSDATHTTNLASPHAAAPTCAMTWPLVHPEDCDPRVLDRQIEQMIFSGDPNAHANMSG